MNSSILHIGHNEKNEFKLILYKDNLSEHKIQFCDDDIFEFQQHDYSKTPINSIFSP